MGKAEDIRDIWRSAWPKAVDLWNSYLKLREPVWCFTNEDAHGEGLDGSFAMIRLTDHLVVINLAQVDVFDVAPYAVQILAHEIGHHVMVPANLQDNARLLAKIRWGLAGIEDRAPFVANLYADQLINHFLHRDKGIDMAAVFRTLGPGREPAPVWLITLRIYEHLWGLDRGDLTCDHEISEEMDADAALGASLIRSYSREWLAGAGRYTALLYPYLFEKEDYDWGKRSFKLFDDASQGGAGGSGVFGMAEVDESELEGQVDPRLEALGQLPEKDGGNVPDLKGRPSEAGGTDVRQRYRDPGVYIDLMKQIDPSVDESRILNSYYRERALPHLVPFPVEMKKPQAEWLPEGTDTWDAGDTMEELDFLESALVSPVIIPGFTTRKRVYGPNEDPSESPFPLDLYIGIDCSGSMVNPARNLSWPVLAGAVIGLSALRAGASVKAVLSGEPGSFMETQGFVDTDQEMLTVLTSYLGTGYAFGIPRLLSTFTDPRPKKTHILIVSDDDIFAMLKARDDGHPPGWDIAELTLAHAGGGGTLVLHSRPGWHKEEVKRLEDQGWNVHYVTDESQLLDFAAAFAEQHYRV